MYELKITAKKSSDSAVIKKYFIQILKNANESPNNPLCKHAEFKFSRNLKMFFGGKKKITNTYLPIQE